jgi:hypothetical protein
MGPRSHFLLLLLSLSSASAQLSFNFPSIFSRLSKTSQQEPI